MAYFKIIRPINLLLLILVQTVIKYGFLEPLGVQVAMGYLDFILLVLATICIAAAGNIINDIHDVAIDATNKPNRVLVGKKLSEKAAYNYYFVLNTLGVGLGFYLSNRLGHPGLAAVFIIISVLLFSYASYIKSILLIGNILVSALVASGLLVLIIFDIYPAITTDMMEPQVKSTKVILWYALAAFAINLIREIVKDIQDINGDKKGGRSTLPIVLGRSRTKNAVFVMGVFFLMFLLLYAYEKLYNHPSVAAYFVFLIAGPLLYFCVKTWNASKPKDYQAMSITLKIVMFTGVCSIPFYAELLKF